MGCGGIKSSSQKNLAYSTLAPLLNDPVPMESQALSWHRSGLVIDHLQDPLALAGQGQ